MSKLRPTLWRTCRVLANETRLQLLWALFDAAGLSVGGLGRCVGISDQNASIQLRLLNSRGLITPHRVGMEVIYEAEPNLEVGYSQELLEVLRECHEKSIPEDRIVHVVTAFTHPRRIQIVQALAASGLRPLDIGKITGIKARALYRHLCKLEARGFIHNIHHIYRLSAPKTPVGRCLLRLALAGDVATADNRNGIKITKVISGGQTGADRAALDAAINCGVLHGGFCPKGRRAEEGPVPARYTLRETESEAYAVRTRANVEAADLTLIFSHGPLTGGSLLTLKFARELGKPFLHVDLCGEFQGVGKMTELFPALGKVIVNVAGPRASNDPEIYDAVYRAVTRLLRRV